MSPYSWASQAWRDLGESTHSLVLITHNPPGHPCGFGKKWTEKVPRSWQEGVTVRKWEVMKEGETFFCRAAGCEVGDEAQQEKNSGEAVKPRGQKPLEQKLPDPRLAHPSD